MTELDTLPFLSGGPICLHSVSITVTSSSFLPEDQPPSLSPTISLLALFPYSLAFSCRVLLTYFHSLIIFSFILFAPCLRTTIGLRDRNQRNYSVLSVLYQVQGMELLSFLIFCRHLSWMRFLNFNRVNASRKLNKNSTAILIIRKR